MGVLRRVVCITLVVVLVMPSVGWGRVVKCETATPMEDESDASLESALAGAVDACVRGATAMGLSWIRLELALLLHDRVIVRMGATDG